MPFFPRAASAYAQYVTAPSRQLARKPPGLSHAEAAALPLGDRLFRSPRTVSSHLYRCYPKLGVAGRHQLRDVIARASTPTPAHESAESRTLL